jgi:glyoxalase family protein
MDLLVTLLGFEKAEEKDGRTRYLTTSSGGSFADVREQQDGPVGLSAVGTVHHVAWRVPDEATQKEWREEVSDRALNVTHVLDHVLDRQYFRSIYFREPGGVLFEIALTRPALRCMKTRTTLARA